jgi:DNA (cytosine-5)-methyltransferase 1
MQAIKSEGTKDEVLLAKALWSRGFRYRKNDKSVLGKPDLTFKKQKVAVFVDSEYFHGKDWETQKYRNNSNRKFWWKKIEGNLERDLFVTNELLKAGWKVLRFWSNDVRKNLDACVDQVEKAIDTEPGTYSEIKDDLQIDVDKHLNNGFASLTHFWHNHRNGIAQYYYPAAKDYLTETILQVATEPEQLYLPIRHDVPFPPPSKPKFKFIDLFAGIGGIRMAYQNVGGKCVFTSEWDKYAKKTYEANFGEMPFGDITQINECDIPEHDLLVAGFPCQPFSIAGVSKKNALGRKHGFMDETQGTLFFDIARILSYRKPKAFMLENVKNLVSHDKANTIKIITHTLEELGYMIYYSVLDSRHFVPQHRERIIIVGFNQSHFGSDIRFSFPKMPQEAQRFGNILDKRVDNKYTLSDKLWNYLQDYAKKHKAKGNGFGFGLTDLNGISRTISARYYKDGAEVLVPQKDKNPRRLTPRECARLQGFPENFIVPVSDNQAYKHFGNSVTVPLIQSVADRLAKVLQSHG